MTAQELFRRTLAFDPTLSRLPRIEWASWWDKTLANWELPSTVNKDDPFAVRNHFGQDSLWQYWLPVRGAGVPAPTHHGAPLLLDAMDYEKMRCHLYTPQLLDTIYSTVKHFADTLGKDGCAFWITLEGFFWFPRTLLGIENHLFAFYDYPELMQTMNEDLSAYHKKCLEAVYANATPQFMTFAEDMSYNNGPMLSKHAYDTFLLPYYKQIVPLIKARGTRVFIDTDGNVEPLIPWFLEAGIEGILPLERMAGVDVCRIREKYPDLLMIGGFDKTVMHKGEAAMRTEFTRLLPAIRSGGYIPSVDHQTPPDVSLEQYTLYMDLLRQFTQPLEGDPL